MAKAVIFDLNGVFIESPPLSKRMELDYNIPVSEFLPVLSKIMDEVRRPHAQEIFDLWEPHLKKWNVPFSKDEFFTYWFGVEKENQAMIDYALKLREDNWLIFALSNNFKERIRYYDRTFDFMDDVFDDVYLSCETGFIKPDKHAFLQILEEYELKPEECYYFDDSEKNVHEAKLLGIHAHKYESLSGIKAVLGVK